MSTKRINKNCLYCGNSFSIPPCRDRIIHCCSSECKKAHRVEKSEKAKQSRKSLCIKCGALFFPRKWQIDTGIGKYCSKQCAHIDVVVAAHTDKANKKRSKSYVLAINEGRMTHKRGEEHPQWLGGKIAARRRRTNSGKANVALKEYRKNNPHKTREWHQNRRTRKQGRLPRGTVENIYLLQKQSCAVCKVHLGDDYHVDHIHPLAKGGKHEKHNIQLLCPTCNVRKSAKEPVLFMQQNGYLL